MSCRRKLSPEQHKQIAERNLLCIRLRKEAAKHSLRQLAREFGVNVTTVENYLERAL